MTHLWLCRDALVALGQHLARRPRAFTVAELVELTPTLETKTGHRACQLLQTAGMIQPAPPAAGDTRANQNPSRPAAWELTAAGREAARAAHLEATSKKRAETMAAINRRPRTDALPARLWTVLRARTTLTADEAAGVLGDAGADLRPLKKAIGKLLSAWHAVAPDLVKVGARRVGRAYQYVLVGSAGRFPPEVHTPEAAERIRAHSAAKAEAKAKAEEAHA
ncbi:hypothetical protein FRC97_19155 [Paracidovorax citrulli]|uniref:hypothetical protein n=1 Tax=Paracidovorax citrulli TaxID=80869 RepID=UPI00066271C3|nr:hypothetical protein [Paracidovorax citrulli]UMT96930.1 hypothetical protein FRC97_19155 [Paracidovorax citrulli]